MIIEIGKRFLTETPVTEEQTPVRVKNGRNYIETFISCFVEFGFVLLIT